jgi:hypothetical protein
LKLRTHRAPDADNVLSNLARIRALELGKLGRAFDLEEYLFSRGRDDLKIVATGIQPDIPIPSLI